MLSSLRVFGSNYFTPVKIRCKFNFFKAQQSLTVVPSRLKKNGSSYYVCISASLKYFGDRVHRISENLQVGSVVSEQVRNAPTEDKLCFKYGSLWLIWVLCNIF
jgi:hypothetical protein